MRKLQEKGQVTSRYLTNRFPIATVFLSGSREGYQWYDNNSSRLSRPSDRTNGILHLASEHKMVAVNSAQGVDLQVPFGLTPSRPVTSAAGLETKPIYFKAPMAPICLREAFPSSP